MLNTYERIKIGEREYPIAFNLNIMEQIQEEYGSFEKWYEIFASIEGEVPYKDLIWTFNKLLNEGADLERDEGRSDLALLNHKQTGRLIGVFGQVEAINAMFALVSKSMPKPDDSKNSIANPTQR